MNPKPTPSILSTFINYNAHTFNLEYFYRGGQAETILFIHGLGGCKENYWEALKSDALSNHTLIALDNPGTGNSTYHDQPDWNVDDLASITAQFIEQLGLVNFWLCGTSMGGLTTLLLLKNYPALRVKGYINIEGNLMPEDCMFSSKVVQFDYTTFASEIFPATIREMKAKGNPGYHIIANNLQLNTNVHAYYRYSFQTVAYSSTGELLQQYLALKMPSLFIYGDENSHLSYLPLLEEKNKETAAIANSNHFVFYDNPYDLYITIGDFITRNK